MKNRAYSPDPEPWDEDELDDETRKMLTGFFASYQAGKCPRCGQALNGERQVGRCVYGVPCGCRLWQGRADNDRYRR